MQNLHRPSSSTLQSPPSCAAPWAPGEINFDARIDHSRRTRELRGLALDAGLVTLPALAAAVDGCRNRAELDGVLLALAADVFLALGGER
jgi:hypothetical protein